MNKKRVGVFITILLIVTNLPIVCSTYKEINSKLPVNTLNLPDSFSWTDYEGGDWTTYVKNQGNCGCVAFCALGAMEAAINIAKGDPNFDRELSEQYVLSCLPDADSCSGGWASEVIRLIKDAGPSGNNINGCPLESCMPYQADDTIPCDEKCVNWDYYTVPPKEDNILWQIKNYGVTTIAEDDPNGWNLLKNWCLNYGPIIVDIYASNSWINYWSSHHSSYDVYQQDDSGTTNNAQLLCGWVDDSSILNGGYWILKNSWGTSWGYNGFSNIAYGCNSLGTRDVTWVETMEWENNPPNNPPNTPIYLYPSNHEINVEVDDILLWTCSDPDGDMVFYDIYFGTSSNPPLVINNELGNTYYPGGMNLNTKYYWKIVAEDEHGASTIGPIWDFTTEAHHNNPPYTPRSPHPLNHEKNVDINTNLSFWDSGDPDVNDTVTYDIYFGSMLPLQKIASNISTTTINPGTLTNGLTYFWNVVAWDNYGASTVGPVWDFTTRNLDNKPPYKPSRPSGQTKGNIGQNYSYTTITYDPEGDPFYCNWSWGDGTYSGWIGPYYNGEIVNQSHIWSTKGDCNIKVKAKDIYGTESNWSEPLVISMPKTYIYNPFIKLIIRLLEQFPFFKKILNQII